MINYILQKITTSCHWKINWRNKSQKTTVGPQARVWTHLKHCSTLTSPDFLIQLCLKIIADREQNTFVFFSSIKLCIELSVAWNPSVPFLSSEKPFHLVCRKLVENTSSLFWLLPDRLTVFCLFMRFSVCGSSTVCDWAEQLWIMTLHCLELSPKLQFMFEIIQSKY